MTNLTWKSVWERKGTHPSERAFAEEDLFAMNGYDTPLGNAGHETREHLVRSIVDTLALKPSESLLDVGCGSGAILSRLRSTGAALTGIDASSSLIKVARRAVPDVRLHVSEAKILPFSSATFDAILSFGVFLYFPDLPYATCALMEMLRVARRHSRLLVADIPDLEKKEQCLAARRAAGASLFPEHLYYPKKFFQDFAEPHSLGVSIWDQNIASYANSPFRFNVLFTRV